MRIAHSQLIDDVEEKSSTNYVTFTAMTLVGRFARTALRGMRIAHSQLIDDVEE